MERIFLFACGFFSREHSPALIASADACYTQAHKNHALVLCDFGLYRLPMVWPSGTPDLMVGPAFRRRYPTQSAYYASLLHLASTKDALHVFALLSDLAHRHRLTLLAQTAYALNVPFYPHLFGESPVSYCLPWEKWV